jgi:succinyl-diaminopimelate desuccinylase
MTTSLVLQIAQELIRCPSVTGPGAEKEVAAVFAHILERECDVPSELISAQPGRPNVIATVAGDQPGPTLLLTGHLDVVPVMELDWTYPPFEAELIEGELWGRGSTDMKGGLAALTAAFIGTVRAGGPARGSLLIAATVDEEGGGVWGLPWLVSEGKFNGLDYAIVAEPAGVDSDFDRLPIATRGSAYAQITVTTGGGHASLGRSLGTHAVSVACSLQQAIETDFRPLPLEHWAFPDGPTVTAGELFTGGQRLGELPRTAEFTVNCRLLPGAESDTFLSELREFLEPLVPNGCSVEVDFVADILSWAPGMDLARTHPFATAALDAVHTAGYKNTEFGGFPAFSEGSFLAARGVPTLPGLGPGALVRAHLPDERVDLAALEASVTIYEAIIQDLLGPDGDRAPGRG